MDPIQIELALNPTTEEICVFHHMGQLVQEPTEMFAGECVRAWVRGWMGRRVGGWVGGMVNLWVEHVDVCTCVSIHVLVCPYMRFTHQYIFIRMYIFTYVHTYNTHTHSFKYVRVVLYYVGRHCQPPPHTHTYTLVRARRLSFSRSHKGMD